MPKAQSLSSSMFQMKCPKCREGDLFKTGSFSFNKPFDMEPRCSVCDQNFMPEPGYYYGAMFISYGITAWLFLGLVSILIWGFGLSINAAFGWLIVFVVITYAYFFRLSRSIWINAMIKYQPDWRAKRSTPPPSEETPV